MLPPTHPLIAAVVAPLAGNAEQRLAANALLEETFDETHPNISQALSRFQKVDGDRLSGLWKWIPPALAGIALIALGIFLIPKIRSILILQSYFGSSIIKSPEAKPRSDLTPQQNLLLGDPRKPPLRQKQDLIASDPDRPDFYADYVAQYLSKFKKLPPDYFETAARIDPENAYFLYLGAAISGKDAVEAIPRTEEEKKRNDLIQYRILDEKRLAESMAVFHQAGQLPRFETYGNELLAERIRLLRQDDLTERGAAIGYVAGNPAPSIWLRELAGIIAAESARLVGNNDAAAIQSLMVDNEHFLRIWSASPTGALVDELVFMVASFGTSAATYDAASKLGLESEAQRLKARKILMDERNTWRRRKITYDSEDIFTLRGGIFPNYYMVPMVGRQVKKSIPITEKDLEPERLVEHEIASQVCLAAGVFMFLMAALGDFLSGFRVPVAGRKIARRMQQLLDKTDWAWILGAGVVFPFIYIITLNRFTPLGGRGYGLGYFGLLFPYFHYMLLVLCTLFAPSLLIRWRLGKRMAPFSPALRISRFYWLALIIGLAYVPCIYLFASEYAGEAEEIWIFLLPPAVLAATMFIAVALSLFGKRGPRISRDAMNGALVPAYSLGILLLALLYPVLSASERHWFAKDTLTRLDPETPAMTSHEYKVAAQLRKETNAILGFE